MVYRINGNLHYKSPPGESHGAIQVRDHGVLNIDCDTLWRREFRVLTAHVTAETRKIDHTCGRKNFRKDGSYLDLCPAYNTGLSAHLTQSLAIEPKAVERLVVRRLVPPEPLPDTRHVAGKLLLHVSDVIELLRQRVIHVDGDHLRHKCGTHRGPKTVADVTMWARQKI